MPAALYFFVAIYCPSSITAFYTESSGAAERGSRSHFSRFMFTNMKSVVSPDKNPLVDYQQDRDVDISEEKDKEKRRKVASNLSSLLT